jgi:ribosomal protein L22
MSPEKSTDEQAPEGEEQVKPAAKAKPAAAKKPAVKKPAAATKKPAARKSAAKDDEPVAAKEKPAVKQAAAEETPAVKKPVAKKQADKESADKKPVGEKPAAEKVSAAEAKEPVAAESEKVEEPASTAARGTQSAAPAPVRRKMVRAQARYVRTSARKARMVCGHLRGKSVPEARAILAFTPREVARDWSKLLESAVANAENNHELIEDDLLVRDAYADEGPTIKRFRPRAQGRATPIRKRTSHLTITLTPKP